MTKQCARCGLYKDHSRFNQCLEHKDKLSHWCRNCDKRNQHTNQPAQWPPVNPLPKPDLECVSCHQTLGFTTDWNGGLIQSCGCGRAYVPLRREAPPVPRQPTGPRAGSPVRR